MGVSIRVGGRRRRANPTGQYRRIFPYGVVPRMMVSPPARDLSIELSASISPRRSSCARSAWSAMLAGFPGRRGRRQGVGRTGVPFMASTFSQTPMEQVIGHAGNTPPFSGRISRMIGSWPRASSVAPRPQAIGVGGDRGLLDAGLSAGDLERGNFPQFRGFCMENYYSDKNFTKHLAKPPREDQAAASAHFAKNFAHPLTWEDLRWIRSQTKLPIAVKGIQHPDDARMAIETAPTCCTAQITVVARPIRGSRPCNCYRASLKPQAPFPYVRLRRAQCDRASSPWPGSHGGRDRPALRLRPVLRRRRELTHYLKSFLAEFDLTLAIRGSRTSRPSKRRVANRR